MDRLRHMVSSSLLSHVKPHCSDLTRMPEIRGMYSHMRRQRVAVRLPVLPTSANPGIAPKGSSDSLAARNLQAEKWREQIAINSGMMVGSVSMHLEMIIRWRNVIPTQMASSRCGRLRGCVDDARDLESQHIHRPQTAEQIHRS
jgi:hypothetical protein